jgi:membrane-associated phospholipid phosphatase
VSQGFTPGASAHTSLMVTSSPAANVPGLTEFLQQLAQWDGAAIEWLHATHWGPLTAMFVLASAWWVKWPLFALTGACCDGAKRRMLPTAALAAAGAAAVAEGLTVLLKHVTERARPPLADPGIEALVTLPESTSFPSGHAATAFAAATAVGVLHPRLRVPLLTVAALVALSRVYLGVHFWSDVLVGSLLGVAIGFLTVRLFQRDRPGPRRRGRSPGSGGIRFARLRRAPG